MFTVDPIVIDVGAVLIGLALVIFVVEILRRRFAIRKQNLALLTKMRATFAEMKKVRSVFDSKVRTGELSYVPPEPQNQATSLDEKATKQATTLSRRGWRKVQLRVEKGKEVDLAEVGSFDRITRFLALNLVYRPFQVLDAMVFLFSLVAPWNTQSRLSGETKELEEAISSIADAKGAFERLTKDSQYMSQKQIKSWRNAKKRREEQRKLQALQEQLGFKKNILEQGMNYHVQRQSPKSLSFGETGITSDSSFLKYEDAKRIWDERLQELESLEEKGTPIEDLLPLYDELLVSFNIDRETNRSRIEKAAIRASKVETRLVTNKSFQHELDDMFGIPVDTPDNLIEAERILSQDVPPLWAHLQWEKFDERLEEAQDLLDQVNLRFTDLRSTARMMTAWSEEILWLKDMERILAEIHKIEVDPMKEWDESTRIFDEKSVDYWARYQMAKLQQANTNLERAMSNRKTQLATIAGMKADEMSHDPDIPKEHVEKLRQLQKEILGGYSEKEANIPVYTPKTGGTKELIGDFVESPMGTKIPKQMASSWLGTDAQKKDEAEKPSRPNTLEAIRQAQEKHEKRRRE